MLKSKRSTKHRDNKYDMSIFEGRVPSRFEKTRAIENARSHRVRISIEQEFASKGLNKINDQRLESTKPAPAEISSIASSLKNMNMVEPGVAKETGSR